MPSMFRLKRNEQRLATKRGETGEVVVWFTLNASKSSATNGYRLEKTLDPIRCMKSQSFSAEVSSGKFAAVL